MNDSLILSDARIIVPVRNGGSRWREAAQALRRSVRSPESVVVIDSGSTDGSDSVAQGHGFEFERIDPRTFNHGRTRQEAVERFCRDRRFVVFLTQDAVLQNTAALINVLRAFDDSDVGAAYGRQLPHYQARPFEAHATLFNYPSVGGTRSLADTGRLGAKVTYLSNSFAAYRLAALAQCGGFPDHLIMGEDAYVAMQMLVSGWRLKYCSDALVRHSHSYSIVEDMQRYFDCGVMHAQTPEIIRRFGSPEGEGLRYVISEMRYILSEAPLLLPQLVARNAAKYLGYRLGRNFVSLPRSLCRRLSMTKIYWDARRTERSAGC